MSRLAEPSAPHSSAWVAQVWISFAASIVAVLGGVLFMPGDLWVKGYHLMGLLFTVGSTMNLAKTTRDNHEAQKVSSVLKDARIERILADQDPLK